MRVAMVSTYPPTECGIATYTQYLTEALRAAGGEVFVLSQQGGAGEDVLRRHRALGDAMSGCSLRRGSQLQTPDSIKSSRARQRPLGLGGGPAGERQHLVAKRAACVEGLVTGSSLT